MGLMHLIKINNYPIVMGLMHMIKINNYPICDGPNASD